MGKSCLGSFFNDNIHFLSFQLWWTEGTSVDGGLSDGQNDAVDYFTFNNKLSAVSRRGSSPGARAKQINKKPQLWLKWAREGHGLRRGARAGPENFWLPVEKGNLHPRGERATHSCPHERHWLSVSKLTGLSRGHHCGRKAAAPRAETEPLDIGCGRNLFFFASVDMNRVTMTLRVLP